MFLLYISADMAATDNLLFYYCVNSDFDGMKTDSMQ